MSIHVTFQQVASNKSPRTFWILAVKNLFRIMIKLMPVSGLLSVFAYPTDMLDVAA